MAKKKLGRPSVIEWSKAGPMWRHKTDKEISVALGTSYTNVYLHRRGLMAKAAIAGKPTDGYVCSKAKWTRAKKVAETI